jgi:hypothetical protein
VWWHTPVNLVLRRLRQEELEFEANLGYIDEFQDNLGFIEKLCPKKRRKEKKPAENQKTILPTFTLLMLYDINRGNIIYHVNRIYDIILKNQFTILKQIS